MTSRNEEHVPADLLHVAERLRKDRPQPTALELDQIKLRARSQAARRAPSLFSRQKGFLMKSRLALTSVLVIGLLMSMTGAGLAVSGIASSGSAGVAQYGAPAPTTPTTPTGGGGGEVLGNQETSPTSTSSPTTEAGAVSPARQVSAEQAGGLPFTGYLAIPLLIVGIAMLATGLIVRRRTARDNS
ncbi:MAG TPA: hypothetical protein VF752_10185 [Thermoleophilaceae bacterium]